MSLIDAPNPPIHPVLQAISRRRALQGSLTIGLAAALPSAVWAQTPQSMNDRLTGDLTPVHDPCIIREGDTYYVYCTTMDQKQQGQFLSVPQRICWLGNISAMRFPLCRLGR